ncbi:crotonase/enoyl-CoA hydratase family protein [Thermomonospora amylolytica]|uniref:crotonase/enoyl-CoA hydratase family protein n=1 Tax=Thermomonospora amylolytica TaxID=1411117 RepID=UPI000E6C2350|nr:crotonase/enoyl-CoA hydratase family protein [Thermomonospora amylolytica]
MNIRTERRGHVLLVTVDRPEARNAFDRATSEEMEAAMDLLDGDTELRCGVITGAGGTFSAGADLKAAARGERPSTERRGGFGLFARRPAKPLIAAVEGHAVAGGFELALACDLVVAAEDARMGLPEVRHNLVAIGGALFRLPHRMPYHLAMELALTAEPRPASFFHQWGLVNRLVPSGTAVAAALELAERIGRNGPLAVAASAQIMRRSADWAEEEAWREQMAFARPAMNSADTAEALRAFAEKRETRWKGV